jgi:hypothetical protein
MRIRLDIPKIYERLAEPEEVDAEKVFLAKAMAEMQEAYAWKDAKEEAKPRADKRMIHLGKALLPSPFSDVYGSFYRRNGLFEAQITFTLGNYYENVSLSKEAIVETHRMLQESFQDSWISMAPTSGYLLMKKKPMIAVVNDKGIGMFTNVNMGTSGTQERKFGTYENFSKDVIVLEEVLNRHLNFGIESAIVKGLSSQNPDLEVILLPSYMK